MVMPSVNADLYVMTRITWDVFGSLTVARRAASDAYLHRRIFALLRQVAKWRTMYFPELLWAYRIESGIDPDHRHLHFLLGGVDGSDRQFRMAMMAEWEILVGKGTARIRQYDSTLSGESYICKCLNFSETYGWTTADQVRLSDSAKEYARLRAHSRSEHPNYALEV